VQLRRLAILAIVVGLPGLAATKTRGPILATLLTAAVCVLLSSRFRLVGAGVIALIGLVIVFFLPQIKSSSVYQNRIDQKQNVEIRLVLQTISLRLAERKPVLGWGYDSFDRIKFEVPVTSSSIPLATALKFTSHDTFLTMLVEYGVVGLALFIAPWAFVLRRGLRAARAASPDRWFYIAGISAVAVIGLTATTLDYRFFSFVPALAWLFLGLIRRGSEQLAHSAG
jgi:O-antigen ligase